MPSTPTPPQASEQSGDTSPDGSDRIQDFLDRHGGPAPRRGDAGDIVAGISGWSEVYAADGYTLRCEWSHRGGVQEMKFTESRPGSRTSGNN